MVLEAALTGARPALWHHSLSKKHCGSDFVLAKNRISPGSSPFVFFQASCLLTSFVVVRDAVVARRLSSHSLLLRQRMVMQRFWKVSAVRALLELYLLAKCSL
jgi:hypothetical protein